MTICNMSIEGGAPAGMVAPDDSTFAYVEGRPHAPPAWSGRPRSSTGGRSPPTTVPVRREVDIDASGLRPVRESGHPPRVRDDRRGGARPGQPSMTRGGGRPRHEPRLHGPRPGTPMREVRPRHDLHRLLHELAYGGPARGRRSGGRSAAVADGLRALRRSRLLRGEAGGRGGGLDRCSDQPGSNGGAPDAQMCLGMNPAH